MHTNATSSWWKCAFGAFYAQQVGPRSFNGVVIKDIFKKNRQMGRYGRACLPGDNGNNEGLR